MRAHRTAWNKGRLVGQKPPLKLKEIWSLASAFSWPPRRETWLSSI